MVLDRAWWAKQSTYTCKDPTFTETCSEYESDPICRQTDKQTCLNYTSEGECQFVELNYLCTPASASSSLECSTVNVPGEFEPEPVEKGKEFPEIAAWLTVLDEMADDNDCEASSTADPDNPQKSDCVLQKAKVCEASGKAGDEGALNCSEQTTSVREVQVFGGRYMYCHKRIGSTCCSSDWVTGCRSADYELRQHRANKTTVFLGERCTKWKSIFFGRICVEKRKEYCGYNSKFARVFQEQFDLQTGAQFAWDGENSPCPIAFTV
jgi:hypothetical protein